MNFFQSNNKLVVFLLLVILLNVFLMYTNYTKNITIKNLITSSEQIIESPTITGTNDLSDLDLRNDLNLILLYPTNYCGACVNLDLQFLREIADKYPDVIYIVDNGIDYNMVSIIDERSEKVELMVLPEDLKDNGRWSVDLPLMYLVDSTGLVILEYESVFGATLEQRMFFERVKSMMALVYN